MDHQVEKSILFIDTKVDSYKELLDGVNVGTKVVILDPAKDGVEQITQTLDQYSSLKDVHILSHGNQAELVIGNSTLNQHNLAKYQTALQSWSNALSNAADILLYGCNVAKGAIGYHFIQQLAKLTGADIAASSNLTGSAMLGGDWVLEKATGRIESDLAISEVVIGRYQSTLASKFTLLPDPLAAAGADTEVTGDIQAVSIDYDSDGDIDFLAYDGTGDSFFRNDGSGVFTKITPNVTFVVSNADNRLVADFDNDGDDDILISKNTGLGTEYYQNDGGGIFSVVANPLLAAGAVTEVGGKIQALSIDYDADGDMDFLAYDGTGDSFFRNDGSGVFTKVAPNVTFAVSNADRRLVADFDNDGDDDILIPKGSGLGSEYYQNNGSGVFTIIPDPLAAAGAVTEVGGVIQARAIDYDSDGDVDFLAYDGTGDSFFSNNGSGVFTKTAPNVTFPASNAINRLVADFDNDGDDDILIPKGSGLGSEYYRQDGLAVGTDNKPPVIASSTPADDATGIAGTANIVLNFDEIISSAGTGTIQIYKASDDSLVESIAGNDGKITGTGGTVITVNPATTLADSTGYYIKIEKQAFFDEDGMTFQGITDKTTLNFTTGVSGPSLTSATYDASLGALVLTGTGFTATAGAINDVIANKITLTGEGGATYQLTTTSNVEITSATAATLSLSAADKAAINQILNKNGTASTGTTAYDVDGAAGFIAASAGIADVGVNSVTVSNVAAPTLTSSTYNAATGVLVLTGTGFLKKSGATNDIDANKFTFSGEGGATYTLTDTADVEITSGTAATIVLSATDKAATNQIVNKTGISATSGGAYNLNAAEDWAAGASAAVNVVDASGNSITASNVEAPTLTSTTYDASTGSLVLTGTGFSKLSGASNDIVANKFTFTGEGGSTYTLTDTANVEITSGAAATLTLSTTDKAAVNLILNKNGTLSTSDTTYNINAAEDWAAGADAAVNVVDATLNAITTSNVAVPTLTSTTYNANTGALVLTGTGFLTKSGAANDIVANKFTFTGEGNATYTLTDTANVEITSGTAATITLSASDRAAINQIINKNGTVSTSGTTYNINAAEDWAAGANAGVNVVDAVGNAIAASNVAVPSITSAAYDYNSNVLTVTGSDFFKNSGASNDITVNKFTVTGEGGATYTLTSASNVEITSGTSFSITLSGADLTHVESLLNKDGIAANSSTTYNLHAAEDWAAGADAAVNVVDATGNGITVSNFAPPTLTSATYDHATGQLVLAGTNFVNQTGATNDIVASLFSLTGEGGSYTLTDTANVEITSATEATLTLSATDQLNIKGVLNKNGTSSSGSTTYNVAAAEDWMSGAPAITNVADLAGNGITVSNVTTPAITSAVYDSDTGSVVVTGTNLFKSIGVDNDVDLSMLTFTGGSANATYTITTASEVEITSETSFSFTLSGADKTQVDTLLDQVGTSSSSGSTYNLAGADNWLSGADLATNIADATNPITVSINPKITSAIYNAGTGSLSVTGSNIQAKTGAANDIAAGLITLTGEGGATYTLTNTANVERTSAASFTLSLSATDKAAVNQIMNKAGTTSTDGTIFNIAAADDWNANVTTGDTSDVTGNALTISNVAVPTLTSTTYDATTGTLVLTGTGFLNAGGAANDIIATMFTFTGEGGATYTLTDTANVEITSGTAATLNLSGTDKLVLNGLLNKNGTTSDDITTYNVAVADNWLAGAAVSVDVSDSTGNGVTVSNVAVPTITSATFDFAAKVLVVTGTNFVSKLGAANDIDLSKITLTGDAGATHALTGASIDITSATSFTVTLSSNDALAISGLLNKNGTASDDSTTYNIAAADNWLINAATSTDISDAAANGITLSNYAAPVITSATYNTANGSLVVTGANFVGKSGATNDVDISTLTITGEAGATYTITSAADIEVFSATEFTLALTGADKAAVDVLLNKSGTSSTDVTTYNVAGADNWMIGAATSQDIADTIGNGITVTLPTSTSTPPAPVPTVDGTAVVTQETTNSQGQKVTTVTVAPVIASRIEDHSTDNSQLADIPLLFGDSERQTTQSTVSLPVGVGITATGNPTPQAPSQAVEELISLINSEVDNDDGTKGEMLEGAGGFLKELANDPEAQLVVHSLVLTASASLLSAPEQGIIISGAGQSSSGSLNEVREALVIDASALPPGTIINLQDVEFAVIIGPATLGGGEGANTVFAGAGSQTIVLGADDDELHGGDGDDIIGSRGGDDRLFGDAGNDRVTGGIGDDYLEGGSGNDILQGGQSEAGTLSFYLTRMGEFHVGFEATYAASAEYPQVIMNTNMEWVQWNQGWTGDPLMAFTKEYYMETISLLYQAVFDKLPEVSDMNRLSGLRYSEIELASLAYRTYLEQNSGVRNQPLEEQVASLMTSIWGGSNVTEQDLQMGVDYISNGGSWIDGFLALSKHDNHKRLLLDDMGELTLVQDFTIDELGWSSDKGSDILLGGDGNDTLVGGKGGDYLNGGNGTDLVMIHGYSTNYGFGVKPAGLVLRKYGEEDTLVDVELLTFSDETFDVSSSNLELDSLLSVVTLFKLMTRGPTLQDLNAYAAEPVGLLAQAEALMLNKGVQLQWGAMDNSNFVSQLSEKVLGTAFEGDELAHWVNQLDSGELSRADTFVEAVGVSSYQDSLFEDRGVGVAKEQYWEHYF